MARLNIFGVLRGRGRADRVDPGEYWESRASDLLHGYDHPETWAKRGWLSAGVEEELVPRLLREHDVVSVLVVGAGAGRQYDFINALDVRGFDLSPSLVEVAQTRYPGVETVVDDLIGAEQRHLPADAVLSTAVLQHVAPDQIQDAARSLAGLARRLIIFREATRLDVLSNYQWAHDYDTLFSGWEVVERVVTDETKSHRTELRALVPRSTRE